MTRIFLENNELDLSKGLSNEITYSIDDLKRIDSKTTAFSKTIVLPGTANNNRLLGNIFAFNNSNLTNDTTPNVLYNFDASITAAARIEVDGLQILKGVFRLLEVVQVDDKIEYECAIFGELGGFIGALGNKKIEELDFSAYDIAWNYTNIFNSWSTIAGSGVYFPLIEYGNESPNDVDFEYTAFRPAFYIKEILQKILDGSGYTYDFPFLSTALMNRLVMPNNQLNLTKYSNVQGEFRPTPGTYTSITRLPLTSIVTGDFTLSGGNTLTYGGAAAIVSQIRYQVGGAFNVTTSLPVTVDVTLWKNATILSNRSFYVTANPQSFSFTVDIDNITINPSDIIYIGISTNITTIRISTGSLKFTTEAPTKVRVFYDDTIVMNDTLPQGIFQRDFFTSIMKMFNLMITEDKYKEKHLIIKPYIDFYDQTIVDWSDKMDRQKAIKIKPMSEVNARFYNFKFKQDNDFYTENYRKKYTENYGDRLYDNALDFAKDSEEVSVIFSSAMIYKAAADSKVYPAIHKKSDNNTKEDRMDSVIRIMQAQLITGVNSWRMRKEISGNVSPAITYYGYAGHLYFDGGNLSTPGNDINFGAPKELLYNVLTYPTDNIFNTYYSPYMAEITNKDSRLLTAYFKLTNLDIFNLDFAKFVYIDGGLYRLQKVYDYSPQSNELTKVDLLRVINKTY